MTSFPLIHAATIRQPKIGLIHLFLRRLDSYRYVWFLENSSGQEIETEIWGANTEEAILAARKRWKLEEFKTLNCGFRYSLPERDEVGTNALFHQMVASYSSMTGIYFDEEVGHNCIVQNASNEAKSLWQRLK